MQQNVFSVATHQEIQKTLQSKQVRACKTFCQFMVPTILHSIL